MKQRVAIQTFGCKANQADTIFLRGLLSEDNYEIVSNMEIADFVVLNTCTVTEQADREARQFIRRAKRLNPKTRVIVTGCYAQTQPEALQTIESVDAVVGNADKEKIVDLLPVVGAGSPRLKMLPDSGAASSAPTDIFKQSHVPSFGFSRYSKNTRAQVKIQDGCNKFCSFCIIPFARGKNRSVPEETILAELHELRSYGFEEAVLTGIHIGTYGLDGKSHLAKLLEKIDHEKPLPRIRLSSLDPEEVSDRLINVVLQSDVICPHFHIAVQSGDNDILKRMKRRYNSTRFYDAVHKITRLSPDVAIGTDVIVGFPGETRECFERTYGMLSELPISYAHVFPYSKRKNTPAASYADHVELATKRERAQQLRELMAHKKQRYYQHFIGKEVEIVVESDRDLRTGKLRGMTRHYVPVLLDGADSLMRQRVSVQIRDVHENRAIGEVLQV